MSKNHTYTYDGPVMIFDRCVMQVWRTTTWAPSEKKARANLAYRYKRDNNLAKTAKVELPGKIKMVD